MSYQYKSIIEELQRQQLVAASMMRAIMVFWAGLFGGLFIIGLLIAIGGGK